jgi:hypothetical protein
MTMPDATDLFPDKEVLSRAEWTAIHAVTDARTVGETMSLMAFAELCNAEHTRRWTAHPKWRWDNSRYVVHLEDSLKRGVPVPAEYLDDAIPDDLRHDGYCFPLLRAALSARAPK